MAWHPARAGADGSTRRTTGGSSRHVAAVVNWGRTGTTGTWRPARVSMEYCAARRLCYIHSGRLMMPWPVARAEWLRWVTPKPHDGAQYGSRPWRTRMEGPPFGIQLGNSPAPGLGTRKDTAACFPHAGHGVRQCFATRHATGRAAGNGNQVKSAQREGRQGRPAKGGVPAHERSARGRDEHGRGPQTRGFEQ